MVKNLRCNQRAQKLLNGECWLEQRQDLELKLCKCKSKESLRPTKRSYLISWKISPRTKCLGPALFLTCHILKQVAKSLWSSGFICIHQSVHVSEPTSHPHTCRVPLALPSSTVLARSASLHPPGTQLSRQGWSFQILTCASLPVTLLCPSDSNLWRLWPALYSGFPSWSRCELISLAVSWSGTNPGPL